MWYVLLDLDVRETVARSTQAQSISLPSCLVFVYTASVILSSVMPSENWQRKRKIWRRWNRLQKKLINLIVLTTRSWTFQYLDPNRDYPSADLVILRDYFRRRDALI